MREGQQDPITILAMPLHGEGRGGLGRYAAWHHAIFYPGSQRTSTAVGITESIRRTVKRKEERTHIDDQDLRRKAMNSLLSREEFI